MHGMLYRHTRTALVVIAATFCGATSERVHAQPVGEIAERRSDLDDLKKRIRDLEQEMARTEASRSSATKSLADAERAVSRVVRELAKLEAERRDHRKLGAELDLFSFPEELGSGLAVWHPRGAAIRRVMEDFSRVEHDAAGYELVFTPHIAKSVLWETSGHLDFYADGMYPPMELEGATYYPKPMNCPMHCLIYRDRQRSYRELPLRLFELGTVYRYERAGTLHGLLPIVAGERDGQTLAKLRNARIRASVDEIAKLGNAGLRAVPSQANFVLVLFEGKLTGEAAYKGLMDAGYIVRWLPGQGLPGALRMTIGTEDETRGLAAAIRAAVEG